MKENEIELSVIIPVYNTAQYIERCILSIINQTYYVEEIICVDDGSTDDGLDKLKELAEKYSNIKIIHQKNYGLVNARKRGLSEAKGKYVTYVDSDDWIEKDMCLEMLELLRESNADIITSGCIRDYGNHCIKEPESVKNGVYQREKLNELLGNMIDTNRFYKSNVSIHICGKIFRRSFYYKYQMAVDDFINIGEDAACSYTCLLNADKVEISGKCFYHYCIRNDSIMGTKKQDEKDRLKCLLEYLKKEFSSHQNRISNIMVQYDFLNKYMSLFRDYENIMYYRNGMFFPFGKIEREETVVVYGHGKFGQVLIDFIKKERVGSYAGWVDKASVENEHSMKMLNEINFDKIIIATLLFDVTESIKRQLIEYGVAEKQILYVDARLLAP